MSHGRRAGLGQRGLLRPAEGHPALGLQATGVGQMSRRDGPAARIGAVPADHCQILEAIRPRDSEGAGLSMSTHRVRARRCVTDLARGA